MRSSPEPTRRRRLLVLQASWWCRRTQLRLRSLCLQRDSGCLIYSQLYVIDTHCKYGSSRLLTLNPVLCRLCADQRRIPEQPHVCFPSPLRHAPSDQARTMTNVLLRKEYPKEYTPAISTQVSNALLVGEIIGQITIGLTCDYLGRKVAIVLTTAMIVFGGILATASSGVTILGMFWMLTIARGIVGFGAGGEYPASSTSASEAANEHALKRRGPIFVLVTNLPLSFGGPLAVSVFLIVLSAAGTNHLSTVWRVCFAIGCLLPLTVFYFRIKMINSKLYRRGAIKKRVPYRLVMKYYWKSLIGTCGAWFIYDFVSFPSPLSYHSQL